MYLSAGSPHTRTAPRPRSSLTHAHRFLVFAALPFSGETDASAVCICQQVALTPSPFPSPWTRPSPPTSVREALTSTSFSSLSLIAPTPSTFLARSPRFIRYHGQQPTRTQTVQNDVVNAMTTSRVQRFNANSTEMTWSMLCHFEGTKILRKQYRNDVANAMTTSRAQRFNANSTEMTLSML